MSILPSLKGFSAKLKSELRGDLRTIDPVVSDAGHRAGRTFGSSMATSLKSGLGRIGQILKTGLVIGAAAGTAALGALTVMGLKSAASLEQTTIGIEALVGSAQEAKKFIGELQQFAAKTPFEFQGVADASRRILAFGQSVGIAREQVIPTLTTIGDLVSVLGGSQENIDSVIRALGQMASKGKVSQEEILQLAEALPGFNANAAIASSLGLSVADTLKLITAGGVDARTGINALIEGMANFKGAAGAMAKQAETLNGVMSTFKDTIAIQLTNAFQPVIPEIKDALKDLTPIVGDAIGVLAPALGEFISKLLPLIGSLVTGLAPILGIFTDLAGTLLVALAPSMEAFGVVAQELLTALAPLAVMLGTFLNEALIALIPAIEELIPFIGELVPPLIDILIALLPLLPPLSELLVLFIKMQAPLIRLVALLLDLFALEALAPSIRQNVDAFNKLLAAIKPAADLVTNLDNWPAIFEHIKTQVGQKLTELGDFFAALPGKVGSFLAGLPGQLSRLALDALNGMLFAVGFGIGRIIRFFIDLPGNIVTLVTSLWTTVRGLFTKGADDAGTAVTSSFDRMLQFVKGLPGRVIDFLRELPGRIVDFATELVPKAVQLGQDIINGVVRGITSTIGNVGSVLSDGFNSALSGLKRGLGIGSPSKVFAEVGEDTIAGYVQGVERSAQLAQQATLGAIAPAAASPAAAPRRTVDVTSSDPIVTVVLNQIREAVRAEFGGDVQFAIGTP